MLCEVWAMADTVATLAWLTVVLALRVWCGENPRLQQVPIPLVQLSACAHCTHGMTLAAMSCWSWKLVVGLAAGVLTRHSSWPTARGILVHA